MLFLRLIRGLFRAHVVACFLVVFCFCCCIVHVRVSRRVRVCSRVSVRRVGLGSAHGARRGCGGDGRGRPAASGPAGRQAGGKVGRPAGQAGGRRRIKYAFPTVLSLSQKSVRLFLLIFLGRQFRL